MRWLEIIMPIVALQLLMIDWPTNHDNWRMFLRLTPPPPLPTNTPRTGHRPSFHSVFSTPKLRHVRLITDWHVDDEACEFQSRCAPLVCFLSLPLHVPVLFSRFVLKKKLSTLLTTSCRIVSECGGAHLLNVWDYGMTDSKHSTID